MMMVLPSFTKIESISPHLYKLVHKGQMSIIKLYNSLFHLPCIHVFMCFHTFCIVDLLLELTSMNLTNPFTRR